MSTLTRPFVLAAALLAAGTVVASAHSNDGRRTDLAQAINAGRDTGAITWSEGRKLRRQLADIDRVQRELKADGHFSAHDRRVIHRMQDALEGQIIAESSDFRKRRFLPRIGN